MAACAAVHALLLALLLTAPADAPSPAEQRVDVVRRVMRISGAVLGAGGAGCLVGAGVALAVAVGGLAVGAWFTAASNRRPIDTYEMEEARQKALVGNLVGAAGAAAFIVCAAGTSVGLGVGGALLVGGWLGL